MRALVRAAIGMALVLSGACSKKTHRPGDCLALPPAERTHLMADPAGGALYWFEETRVVDFESEIRSSWNLVHYDLRARHSEVVLRNVDGPLHFLGDKIVILRAMEPYSVALVDRDRHVQTLTPEYLDVIDVEVIDDHTLAILATGDGRRAVYTLDLARPRPIYLTDAEILLSATPGRVYVQADGMGMAIDTSTGEKTRFELPKNATPNADHAVFVEDSKVRFLDMQTGTRSIVMNRADAWKLVHQDGSVLARTAPKKNESYASLVAAGTATPLSTLRGGTSILGATTLGGETWAVVGHNTANYIGDLAATSAETDVCLLPRGGSIVFPTRNVPLRYLDKEDRLLRALAIVDPGATVQILDAPGAPTTVDINLKKEAGGTDLTRMRRRARELYEGITSMLGDREIRTEVNFGDERKAIHRWRRGRLRFRTAVGMGDALLTDAADFDLEVRDLDNVKTGPRTTCSGTLVNTQARKLENLELRCTSNRTNVIRVAELGPNATHTFAQTFEGEDDGTPLFEVFRGREQLEVRDAADEARTQKVFELALRVYTETSLALEEHSANKEVIVTVLAQTEFLEKPEEAKRLAATNAYREFEALRAIYGLEPTAELSLHIRVLASEVSYDFDGTQLTLDE